MMGAPGSFAQKEEFEAWRHKKRLEMDDFGIEVLRQAAASRRVVVVVTTITQVEVFEGTSTLRRFSNSCLLDHRGLSVASDVIARAARVASVFNPDFRRNSELLRQGLV